jgi:adenosine deaminase
LLKACRFSTRAVLRDFQADGVVYLELRTTPRAMPDAGLTKDDYVKTILDILNAHNQNVENTMRAFLILSIDRRNTVTEAQEVVDLAIKYQSFGVVGVDLCGDPAKGDVRIFAEAFARAKTAGLKTTLHFAETELSSSDLELLTLLSWKPDRLGHVIHVKEEYRSIIEKENIGVELCLSCNVHAKMITGTYSDHHFGMWRHSTVPVALSVRHLGRCFVRMLTAGRPTTSVSSAVHCLRSTTSQRNISHWIALTFGSSVKEPWTRSSVVRMREHDCARCTPHGVDGSLESRVCRW